MRGARRAAPRPEGVILSGFFLAMVLGAAVLAVGAVLSPRGALAETVPTDSWVYDALRSFELRGLVHLEPTLPYTFDQCEQYTREIVAHVEKEQVRLGSRHAYLLELLRKEFIGLRDRPEDRYDRYFYVLREEDRYFAFDAELGATAQKKVDEKKGEADGLAVPHFLVGFGHRMTMETNYRLVMAPEWGTNAGNEKPNARLKSYRGLTAEFERGLLDANGDWWEVRLGRERIHWGSNFREGLLLSRTAGSLDQVSARFKIGPFAMSTFQAILDPHSLRHLAGHRLTVALPRGIFLGLGETVVYQRNLDFKYLMPLGIFYAHQFNEEASNDDNILWGFDWKVPARRGLIFHGQFLIDDFQYERGAFAGADRLGFDVAADALFMVGGRELEISGGYTYIDIYTYGHWAGTQYVAGDGSVRMNPLLAAESLGPDADRVLVKATLGLSARAALAVEGVSSRYGAGSSLFHESLPDWQPGMERNPHFPSYPILYSSYAMGSLRYDLNRGSYISAGGAIRYRDRGADNLHKHEGFGWLELLLDL